MIEFLTIQNTLDKKWKVRYRDILEFYHKYYGKKIWKRRLISFLLVCISIILQMAKNRISNGIRNYSEIDMAALSWYILIFLLFLIAMTLDKIVSFLMMIKIRKICKIRGIQGGTSLTMTFKEDILEYSHDGVKHEVQYILSCENEKEIILGGIIPIKKNELSEEEIKFIREKLKGKLYYRKH